MSAQYGTSGGENLTGLLQIRCLPSVQTTEPKANMAAARGLMGTEQISTIGSSRIYIYIYLTGLLLKIDFNFLILFNSNHSIITFFVTLPKILLENIPISKVSRITRIFILLLLKLSLGNNFKLT